MRRPLPTASVAAMKWSNSARHWMPNARVSVSHRLKLCHHFDVLSENGGERDDKLKRLNAMREEEAAVDAELTLLRANDPELLQALRDDVAEAQQAVERWTDNLATLRDFARDTLNFDNAQFDANFGCEGICE